MEYPKMLYRDGAMIEVDGKSFDYVIVNDEAEEKAATGYGPIEAKPKGKK